MGVVIPFKSEHYDHPLEDDATQILSDKHKSILRTRLKFLIRMVTDKELKVIHCETPKKLESIRSSKEFVNKMLLRVNILYQLLFDSDFPKSRATEKAIAAGLLYLVSTGDLMSDNIPGLGYLDDSYIISEVWKRISGEVSNYLVLQGLDTQMYM